MAERPSTLRWLVWSGALLFTSTSLWTFVVFATLFLRPHAFGARDGQGAAVLAVAAMAVSLAATLVGGLGTFMATRALAEGFGVRWVVRAALGSLTVGVVFGLVVGLLS